MMTLQRILFPTDFSDWTLPARDYACLLAGKFDAELHLLHVLPDRLHNVPSFGIGLVSPELLNRTPEYDRKREAAAVERLKGTLDENWRNSNRVHCATRWGSAYVETIRYARKHDIDLIVMGTHGWSGLRHVLLGSVAENVIRHAPCPVLTVRPEKHEFVLP